jgi:hypothetical protein
MKLFAPVSRPEPVVADTASVCWGRGGFQTMPESNYEIWRAHGPILSFGFVYIKTHSLNTSYPKVFLGLGVDSRSSILLHK